MWVVVVSDSDGFPAEALGPFGDEHEAATVARHALKVIHTREPASREPKTPTRSN